MAAAVVEGLTLHAGHVEEVVAEHGTAGTRVLGEPARLGDFWMGGAGGGETVGGHSLSSRPSGSAPALGERQVAGGLGVRLGAL